MDDEEFQQKALELNGKVMNSLNDRQSYQQSTAQLKHLAGIIKQKKCLPDAPIIRLEKLEIVVLTNLACIYRKKGNYSIALYYLKVVQSLEQKNVHSEQDAGSTYSNLCAVYSEMGRHEEALKQMTIGIGKLQNTTKRNPTQLNWVNLIIGYHNFAIECQFLKMYEQAQKILEKAIFQSQKQGITDDGDIFSLLKQTLDRVESKKNRRQQKLAKFYQRQYKHRTYFKNRSILEQTLVISKDIDDTIDVKLKSPATTKAYFFQNSVQKPKYRSNLQLFSAYNTRKKSLSRENDRPPTRMSSYTQNSKMARTMSVTNKQQTLECSILQYAEDRKKTRKSFRKRRFLRQIS